MTAFEYFPPYDAVNIGEDVTLWIFRCGETTVQLSHLVPCAHLARHRHVECQFGMALKLGIEIDLDGHKQFLHPFRDVYSLGPNTPHGAVNPFSDAAMGLDVKRAVPGLAEGGKAVHRLVPTQGQAAGLVCESVEGPWFNLAHVSLPPGGELPARESGHEQIGLVLDGGLHMEVGGEQRLVQYGGVYYAPASVRHGGRNTGGGILSLLQIAIPANEGLSERRKRWI